MKAMLPTVLVVAAAKASAGLPLASLTPPRLTSRRDPPGPCVRAGERARGVPSTMAELSESGMANCSATTPAIAAARNTISVTRNGHVSGVGL